MSEMNKQSYQKLIEHDLDVLNKSLPESLEKDHIKLVLCKSIDWAYPDQFQPTEQGKDLSEKEIESAAFDFYQQSDVEIRDGFDYADIKHYMKLAFIAGAKLSPDPNLALIGELVEALQASLFPTKRKNERNLYPALITRAKLAISQK